ncbi:MAG: GNAT family N-acetyltransferase [Chloroflexi bacterium]|nr:GNAT family N-acetyltransferase [Chloroflexota bacterium]
MWLGEKVELAAIKREYLPRYVEWLNDWEVARYLMPGMPQVMTLESETEWFDARQKDKSSFVFAILGLPEKNLIGNCGLHNLDLKNRCAVFGIFIGDKNYWSKGYGTDATRTLLRFAFEQLGLNRVELEVYDYNPRAMRAYEKAGFRRDGTRRQALFRDGDFHDIHLMGILREEWKTS